MFDARKFARFFKRLVVSQLLLGCMFIAVATIVNFLQLLIIPLRWCGWIDLQRSINQKLTYLHWILVPAMGEWWADLDIRVHCSEDSLKVLGREKAILVMNHKSQLDWIVLWMIAENVGVMQNIKAVAKSALTYVPVVGPAFLLNEFIFLRRNFAQDKATIAESVKRYVSMKYSYWLLLFCEGTRFTPAKHKASVEFAAKKGLQPLKHHLVPRTKGFTSIVEGLRESGPPVYDFTVCFARGREFTLSDYICGEKIRADVFLRRIPMNDVPRDEDQCAEYVHQLYREKDELCEFFKTNGHFPTGEDDERYRDYIICKVEKKRRKLAWLLFWATTVGFVAFQSLLRVVSHGSWFQYVATTILLVLLSILYRLMISMSTAKSSYGKQ